MADRLDILISFEEPQFEEKLNALRSELMLSARFGGYDSKENHTVIKILREVAKHGDRAVSEYTKSFDNVDLEPDEFKISKEALRKAHSDTDKTLLASIQEAIRNVRKYQTEIFVCGRETHPGIKYSPVRRVGICVPGASAPLPSTVIMTAVPAQVAGVKEIAIVSPPRYADTIHPVILAACHELKIDEVYRIGGVQAVAALAHGTEKIKKVDKIVGPGNAWVQAAKKMVSGDYVGIDSIAGPSEVLIIADSNANPEWVAVDMLSQIEHAPGSAIVFTDSRNLAENILNEINKQMQQLSRKKEIIEYLKRYSLIAVFEDMNKIIDRANDFAIEHLQIQCRDESRKIAGRIENAGAIFIGEYSPVAVGDYWAGPSHTLPTGGRAKFYSALSSNDFVKSTSIIEYSRETLAKSAPDIIRLARIEGLDAHARSVEIRQDKK